MQGDLVDDASAPAVCLGCGDGALPLLGAPFADVDAASGPDQAIEGLQRLHAEHAGNERDRYLAGHILIVQGFHRLMALPDAIKDRFECPGLSRSDRNALQRGGFGKQL